MTKENLLHQPLVVINVGLIDFADNLEQQDLEGIQVDWSPPAGGDPEMIELLNDLL